MMRIRHTFGPVPDATRAEAEAVARDAFGLLARFARARFRVPGWWSPDFRTDWSERRTSSGGRLDRIIAAAVAHETAHSLADLLKGSDPVMFSGGIDEISRRFRPHGGLWLDVYRELRTRVVNAGTRVPEEGWAGIAVPPPVWCGAAFSPWQDGVQA